MRERRGGGAIPEKLVLIPQNLIGLSDFAICIFCTLLFSSSSLFSKVSFTDFVVKLKSSKIDLCGF